MSQKVASLFSDRCSPLTSNPFLAPTFHLPLGQESHKTGRLSFQKEEGGFQVSTSLETLARRNYSVGRWAALRSAVGQRGGGDVRRALGREREEMGKTDARQPEERMWLCLCSEGHILLLSHTFPSRKMKIGTSHRSDLVTVYCMGGASIVCSYRKLLQRFGGQRCAWSIWQKLQVRLQKDSEFNPI